jgi:hypothetical protein
MISLSIVGQSSIANAFQLTQHAHGALMTLLSRRLASPLAALSFSSLLLADPSWQEQPAGPVILTVSGELQCCPSGTAYFDLQRLDAMPQTEVKTLTPWTDSSDRYSGVRLSELLQALGAKGKKIDATALNDYITQFSNTALLQYPVILATRRNDQPMRIRDKGPIWIIYPLDDHPQLRKEEHHHAMVWQLKALQVSE